MVRQARRRPSARQLAAAALLGPDLGLRWARRAMAAAERWPAACDGVWQRGCICPRGPALAVDGLDGMAFSWGEEAGAVAPDRGFGMVGAAGGAVPAMADAE